MRNDGTKTWQAGPSTGSGHPVRLGVRWYRVPTNSEVLLRDVVRVGLPRDVGPGDSVTLTLPVLAPFTPGVYNLLFDLIEEGVQEFRQAGSKPYLQTVTVTAPPYYASFISAPVPDKLAIDQVKSVRFTVRNDGSKTWLAAPATGSGAAPVRLAYTWLNAQNESVPLHASRDLRASLPRDIGPGETCDLNVELLAPDRPGSFTLHCDLLEEGVTSFADMGSPPLRASVQVQGAQDFQVTFGDPLTILPPATPFSMNVKIRNDGNKTWYTTGPHPVKLGSHWFDARNDGARTSDTVVPVALDIRNPLPFDVAPGQEAVFSAQTFAPDKPGRYRLQWSLVVEGMLWFYDLSARVLELPVQVTPVGAPLPPPTASILSSGVQPTMAYRAALKLTQPFTAMEHDTPAVISLSLRNDGARTWAAGGDSPVYVGTQWFRGSEPVPVQPDLRTALPEDVQPGQAITFGAQVYPPETPGNYTLRLDLIEGEVWFADVKTSIPLDLMVEVKQAAPRGLTISTSHNPEAAHLAIDGNPHTTWDSGQPMEPGMWVQCDLGARRTIDALFITSGGRGFPAGCEAQVSADGFAWAAVGRRERNWGDVTFTFAPLAARYIRIAQTGRSLAGEPWQIAAIAVHEAAPWQAVASHNPNLAGLAFDHNPDTLWTSAAPQEPGMTFTLDMGAQHTITGLTLENGPRPEYPQGYRLMIATDGEDWQEVAHSPETGNWSPLSLTFDPVPVRYIRIECTAASRWQPWSISQIWVLRSVGEWEALAVGVAR
ncbi:MAG: discoidin domain-containing protein [Chloroflexi bacterium]|nr:discoidin domain-containing protein [Chloroflexota bacterium]